MTTSDKLLVKHVAKELYKESQKISMFEAEALAKVAIKAVNSYKDSSHD